MSEREKKWHWIYRQKEFTFADTHTRFAMVHYTHPQNKVLEMHKHSFVELVYIISGHATHVLKTEPDMEYRCLVGKGDIFIINPDEEHTYLFDQNEPLELLNINFDPSIIDGQYVADCDEVRVMDFLYYQPHLPLELRFGKILKLEGEDGAKVNDILQMMVSEYSEQKLGHKLIAQLGLCQILALLSRKYIEIAEAQAFGGVGNGTLFTDVLRVKGFIGNHYCERIYKEQLAKIGKCSVRQLSRKFKEYTGQTVVEYILNLRIRHVKSLLAETEEAITKIALESGFQDISYFNRTFRAHVGFTPKEYRDQYTKKDRLGDYAAGEQED